MFRQFLSPLLAGLAITSADAAIDFSPMIEEYAHAGFEYRKVTFKEDNGTVTFTAPQGWSIRGADDRAELTPPDKPFAEGAITAAPLPGLQQFDEAAVHALEQQVLASAPPTSQSVQVVRRRENPVTIGANTSCEIVISYAALGHVFERSVIFVHTADTQLVFRLTATKADFGALHSSFLRSISSWEYIENKLEGTAVATAAGGGRLAAAAAK